MTIGDVYASASFWEWVNEQEVTDDPAGDFIDDTKTVYSVGGAKRCQWRIYGTSRAVRAAGREVATRWLKLSGKKLTPED